MKFLKGISLFFIYPCIMLGFGMYVGIVLDDFFYPGQAGSAQENTVVTGLKDTIQPIETYEMSGTAVAVSTREDVLNADTEYVIEEYDTRRDTLVETTWKVPEKYLGMNRESFVTAMELYALSPPLSELERGFVGLEVRSFSAKRVVVRMNYDYVEPTESFYLRVEDNLIVVYCDDKKTVYLYTDISAQSLPEYIQSQVIMGMFIEDEAALYHFLETYSS